MSICGTAISDETRIRTKPLAVSVKAASKIIGVGNTTMWALIKANRVQTIAIGRRRLVVYASLESLLAPTGAP